MTGTNAFHFGLGRRVESGANYDMNFDNLYFYNRTLNQADVDELYNNGNGR